MQERQRLSLFQIGAIIALVGVALQVALRVAWVLAPMAHVAVIVGVILLIAGLVMPNRRF